MLGGRRGHRHVAAPADTHAAATADAAAAATHAAHPAARAAADADTAAGRVCAPLRGVREALRGEREHLPALTEPRSRRRAATSGPKRQWHGLLYNSTPVDLPLL